MLNNGNKSICKFEDVIVSYIYDESSVAERRDFESHLLECSSCTYEFASISSARYSVFEWHKEEFADLATPQIVIPYAPKKPKVIEENESIGFLDGLRGLFSGSGWPVTVAAALIICLGVGFAALTFLERGEQPIASNVIVDEPTIPSIVTQEKLPDTVRGDIATVEIPDAPNTIETSASNIMTPVREIQPVKATRKRRSNPSTQNKEVTAQTRNTETPPVAPQLRQVPVLSNYVESDDKSLRLTDLFDQELGDGG